MKKIIYAISDVEVVDIGAGVDLFAKIVVNSV
jgi:hypothetical protein